MKSRTLALCAVLSMLLPACSSSVRESRPLQYPGNSVGAAEALGTVISRRGFAPSCKPREFCKFKYAEQVTLHFKIRPGDVTLSIDIEGGEEMAPADLQKLVAAMNQLGQDIWNEAQPMALAQQEQERQAAEAARIEAERQAAIRRAEWERQKAEAARIEAERQAAEAARIEAERQAAARQVYPEITHQAARRGAAFHFELPQGSHCQIEGDSAWTVPKQVEIPFQVPAIRDVYYTFDCQLAHGVVWHQKLQAKDGFVTTVRLYQGAPPPSAPPGPLPMTGPAPTPTLSPPPPPPPPPPPDRPTRPVAAQAAMNARSFASLKASVEKESFSSDKLRPIEIAAASGWFTAAQVAELVELMSFSADKLKVVELTRNRIVDRQNAHVIVAKFTFSSDKEKATKMLTP